MAFKLNNCSGSINIRLTCLTVLVIAVLSAALVPPAQAAINDNEAQTDAKIVNQGSGSAEQLPNGPRSSILDNIFNIPIQTLKAVNNLVQSIAGNLQAAGSGTYFSQRNERQKNNHDDDGAKNDRKN
ncbi:uncharacterized protein LOC119768807 [Culex quinquefasciatus]|uniref:(northern house mosquito) hypothetical protein n=1 Tax=Culex pipiens TaxID=7175 RepID=A0A8D8G9C1_CULPI|nr:uncharacterized protein LOC119768807 [Culex quinquefasciatus]XP_038116014.1 uncharacterized protein LOC119768807 [Culex quinquefasciatus]